MSDELIDALGNACADLVSERRYEPALTHLFRAILAGQWVPVHELFDHTPAVPDRRSR